MTNFYDSSLFEEVNEHLFPTDLQVGRLNSTISNKGVNYKAILPYNKGIGFIYDKSNMKLVYDQIQFSVLKVLNFAEPGSVKISIIDYSINNNFKILTRLKSVLKTNLQFITDMQKCNNFMMQFKDFIRDCWHNHLGHNETIFEYNQKNLVGIAHNVIVFNITGSKLNKDDYEVFLNIESIAETLGIILLYAIDISEIEKYHEIEWCKKNGEMIEYTSLSTEQVSLFNEVLSKSIIIKASAPGIEGFENIPAEYIHAMRNYSYKLSEYSDEDIDIMINHLSNKYVDNANTVVRTELDSNVNWNGNSSDSVHIPIGHLENGNVLGIDLYTNNSTICHAIIGGITSSGKTILLHNIIQNAAKAYAPDELQFVMLDYKDGSEFMCYEHFPHARIIGGDGRRETGLEVLRWIKKEMDFRSDLFTDTCTDSNSSYRRKTNKKMPRLIVIIDEYWKLFGDDRLGREVLSIIDEISRQGRTRAVNLILSSQDLKGLQSINISNFQLRVALKMSLEDSKRILVEGNYQAADLRGNGDGIFNDNLGSISSNIRFQTSWIDKEQVFEFVNQLEAKAQNEFVEYPKTIVREKGRKIYLNKVVAEETRCGYFENNQFRFAIGETFSLDAPPVFIDLKKRVGGNVLIAGNDEHTQTLILELITSQVLSANSTSVFLIDFLDQLHHLTTKYIAPEEETFVYIGSEEFRGDWTENGEFQYPFISYLKASVKETDESAIVFLVSPYSDVRMRKNGSIRTMPVISEIQNIMKIGASRGIHFVIIEKGYKQLNEVFDINSLLLECETRIALSGTDSYKILDGGNPSMSIDGQNFAIVENINMLKPIEVYNID